MLIYSFTVLDEFNSPLPEILKHIPNIVEEQSAYEGDWPEKYEVSLTMPPEVTEEGKRYYFHVWEV
jgi:hypothetical protein